MSNINKLNKMVETLHAERKQLVDTIASQQQSIALKDAEIAGLKKLNDSRAVTDIKTTDNTQVKTSVEQKTTEQINNTDQVKTSEELHQSIVEKFRKLKYEGVDDVCLCLIRFEPLNSDELSYLCRYFNIVVVDSFYYGKNFHLNLNKYSSYSDSAAMSAGMLNTKAREFLRSVDDIDDKIDVVLANTNKYILDSLKKISFKINMYGDTSVRIIYDTPLNIIQKEFIKDKLSKGVDVASNGVCSLYLSFADLYLDFGNMMGYTDKEKRVKFAV
jgi:hypothetical protein